MNRIELKQILLDAGVPPLEFSLFKNDRRKVDTVVCLWPTSDKKYEFYIYERGKKYEVREYSTENDGCKAVLEEFSYSYPELIQYIK
ncbi:hypothetical protein [Veillonella intestinalis]|uniref:hypothetical protein n=1 Tax=Veillonella intestinalis TaxID=2941341 RepID=UPI002040D55A|nr:hypothetical protein [Veillonella intestinalis]